MGETRAARQRHPGRRRLQVDRRRQDVDARGPREDAWRSRASASTRRTPTSSTSRRSAIRTDRTRSAACSSRTTAARRGRRRSSATTRPARSISSMDPKNPDVLYAGLWEVFRTPHSLSSGGPGSGLFKTTDGGAHVDRADEEPRAAETDLGQGRRLGLGRRSDPRLRDHRGGRRRRLPVRRRRRDLEAGQRRSATSAARVLLHAHLRRPAGRRTRSTSSIPASIARPTPARRIRGDPRAARRQPRSVDRAERPDSG